MKMVVTYEAADIRRLIQRDLARQGIRAEEANIRYSKNAAVVTVEVEGGTGIDLTEEQQLIQEATAIREISPLPVRAEPIVDMTDVLTRSAGLARTEGGLYPHRERALMEGETYDYPGDRRR